MAEKWKLNSNKRNACRPTENGEWNVHPLVQRMVNDETRGARMLYRENEHENKSMQMEQMNGNSKQTTNASEITEKRSINQQLNEYWKA